MSCIGLFDIFDTGWADGTLDCDLFQLGRNSPDVVHVIIDCYCHSVTIDCVQP